MSQEYDRRKVVTSFLFKFTERIGYQGITFIVQIILARMLSPSDYGMLALMVVFVSVSQVFVQSGLNTALVQRKDIDDSDYSSVFFLSVIIALALYGVLFFCAPLIASFYEMPELSVVLRVLALILMPGAFYSVQSAKATREMLFNKLMYGTVAAAAISGIIGITMAYLGYGIWALIGQQLSNQLTVCVVLYFTIKWRPRIILNFTRIKEMFSFGWKLLCINMLDILYTNIQNLIVGRRYAASTLGFFNRGNQLPLSIMSTINASIQAIILPTLSRQQDNVARMRDVMHRFIVTSCFFTFPLMMGLAVMAEPFISLLLTDKWLSAVPYLRIACFNFVFWPFHTANIEAVKAQGKSIYILIVGGINLSLCTAMLWVTVYFFDSPVAIALGVAVLAPIAHYINAVPNKKLLNYGFLKQIRAAAPSIGLSIIMGICIYLLSLLQLPSLPTIILQVILGAAVYLVFAWLLKLECLMYLISTAVEYLGLKNDSANKRLDER